MTKAFAYLRVSGKGQVDGDGFTRQLAAIKGYAQAHEIRIERVFKENGVSGSIDNMNRPAWQELMATLHSNGVRTVVIEKLDRLARDLMVQETAIADLRKHGFTLVSVEEPDLMASDGTRVLIRQVMGAIGQYDKTQIVAKLRGARMRIRASKGKCEGAKVYGHYEGENAVLSRMRELRSTGLGFDKLAAQLNAEGFKPRRGALWYGITVNKILTREKAG